MNPEPLLNNQDVPLGTNDVVVIHFVSWVDFNFLFFCVQEIAELYEQEQNLEKAMVYYDKAVDLYQGEEVNSSANQCRLKIAQYAAELEQ